ncbi:MAG: hypothetical protein KGH64_00730 [Candidatus Micrarchaeota archaeon]|nr:hypothetical protein [Candidatus Micrarchaeota archaeon]
MEAEQKTESAAPREKIGVFVLRKHGALGEYLLYVGYGETKSFACPIGLRTSYTKEQAIKEAKEICDNLGFENWVGANFLGASEASA